MAKQKITTSSSSYDVVLLDRNLGDGVGEDLFCHMTGAYLPGLIFTISSEPDTIFKAVESTNSSSSIALSPQAKQQFQARLYNGIKRYNEKQLDSDYVMQIINETYAEYIDRAKESKHDDAEQTPKPVSELEVRPASASLPNNTVSNSIGDEDPGHHNQQKEGVELAEINAQPTTTQSDSSKNKASSSDQRNQTASRSWASLFCCCSAGIIEQPGQEEVVASPLHHNRQ